MRIVSGSGNRKEGLAPHSLIYSVRYLPKSVRSEFPILKNLDLNSDKYVDEIQILDPKTLRTLLEELRQLRKLSQFQFFMNEVDGQRFYERWKRGETNEDFNKQLDLIEYFILKAIKNESSILVSL